MTILAFKSFIIFIGIIVLFYCLIKNNDDDNNHIDSYPQT